MRAVWICSLALLFAACARNPEDDPEYQAACHGPPVYGAEARQAAREQGYTFNTRYDCIDRKSWEQVRDANALVNSLTAQAEREAKASAASPPRSLADARLGFHSGISAPATGTPLPNPPPALFVRSDYTGGEGRPLAAFVTPDPRDQQKHAAIVWITGGDSSTLEDFWSEGPPDNDQSASAFRKAGMIMMFPTLRGGNVDSGRREFFYGEVDDVHAAANLLAKLPYVDPARIYLGGHSTGGTLALLAAETGGRFAAVFAFGPVSAADRYPENIFPGAATAGAREISLRSPLDWLNAISTPTYLIEGAQEPGNAGEVDRLCHEARIPQVHCVLVPAANHFSVIDRVGKVLAPRLVAGTTAEAQLLQARDFGGEPPQTSPAR
jgi:dienelactone hydrolase